MTDYKLLLFALKPLQISVKFLDTFKPRVRPLLFKIKGVFLFSLCNGKLMSDLPGGLKYIVPVHSKKHIFYRFVGICNLQKMQIALFLQLPFLENIAYMPGNDACVTLEQFRHLRLGKPYGFIGKEDIDLYDPVLRLVYLL